MLLAKLSTVALTGGQGRWRACTDSPCNTGSRTSASTSAMWPVSTTMPAFACTSKQCLRAHQYGTWACRSCRPGSPNRLMLRHHNGTNVGRACSMTEPTEGFQAERLRMQRTNIRREQVGIARASTLLMRPITIARVVWALIGCVLGALRTPGEVVHVAKAGSDIAV